jgi:hypothetical protein
MSQIVPSAQPSDPASQDAIDEGVVVDLGRERLIRGRRRFAAQYPRMATFQPRPDGPGPDGAA